jgi:ferredoxin
MIRNVHFVYFSPCGGTENVIKALERDISLPIQEHNITLPRGRARNSIFGRDELVFMGFPVYAGHMPRYFPSLIAHLKGTDTPAVLVSVYGNREYDGAFLDMHEAVRANGFKPVAAIAAIAEHSIFPELAANRPDADDKEKLAGYGVQALRKAENNADMIAAPGAVPTLDLPLEAVVFPHTDAEACTKCGDCVRVCPNEAIPADAPETTLGDRCLFCAACVKYCPPKARMVGTPETKKMIWSHLKDAVARKEAELFL